jgi:hypothetical protein
MVTGNQSTWCYIQHRTLWFLAYSKTSLIYHNHPCTLTDILPNQCIERQNFVFINIIYNTYQSVFSIRILIQWKLPYFSIDNAHLMHNVHPNIFITPFNVRTRQLVVELGSTDRGWRNSLKACALLVVILSLMKNFLDLNSLVFNKY